MQQLPRRAFNAPHLYCGSFTDRFIVTYLRGTLGLGSVPSDGHSWFFQNKWRPLIKPVQVRIDEAVISPGRSLVLLLLARRL